MYAYVINLARSADRRAHITAELKKTGLEYEIVTAVDGRDLDLSDTTVVDPSLRSQTEFVPGAAGAALSHLSVYRKIIADGRDAALVLEDDVTLPADLGTLTDAVAGHLAGAEVALLSCDCADICKMSREGSLRLPAARQLALPIDIKQPASAGGYIITREACERMSQCVLPVRMNPDNWCFYYRQGALDRVRCVVPLPVLKVAKFVSTVGSYSLGSGIRARLVWPLVRREVPILHQVLCYRRQQIYREWARTEFTDLPFIEMPSRIGLG